MDALSIGTNLIIGNIVGNSILNYKYVCVYEAYSYSMLFSSNTFN